MKELAGVLFGFLSLASYFGFATRMALYQRWPIPHYLGGLAACAFLAFLVYRQTGLRRFTAAAAFVLTLGLTGLFVWYTLDYSVYDDDASAALETSFAESLQGLVLASHGGEPVPVFRTGDSGTLYVFYRGFW